jgi:biotin carboxyl carrier protein
MPGEIFKILVNEGNLVEEGCPLLILVSMKMENTIVASESGIIKEIYIAEGETVQSGKLLMKIETKKE